MTIFRKDLPMWKRIVCLSLLFVLGLMGLSIALINYTNFGQANKSLLESIAFKLFFVWWFGVIILAFCEVLQKWVFKSKTFGAYYTSLGIVLLIIMAIVSSFIPGGISNVVMDVAYIVSLVLCLYDIFRIYILRK